MIQRAVSTLTLLAVVALPAAAGTTYSHQEYFEHYDGTQTCLECHQEEAESFFHSQHYQWLGDAPDIIDANGKKLGKRNTINDFCTNPMSNWIGIVENSQGHVLSEGCSKCHAGLGLIPSETMSQEQLENIDCLICHATGYRRDLYTNADGSLEWKPILWKNQEGLDSVAKRITMPTRANCLRCHSGSGGGPNFKRGDLEYALADTDAGFDVHMGTDGGDLACVACHAGEDHRVRGRGTDLSGTDIADHGLSCDNGECHSAAPHKQALLNQHALRVYCTVCHIPTFAKEDATDMVRDWSTPFYKAEADKYTATITMGKDVEPVIAWYNGKTWEQLPGVEVTRQADGTIGMMVPQGSKNDPGARLYAFKLHRGTMPVLKEQGWIVPILVEEFFADGNIDQAVRAAAEEMYGLEDISYEWVPVERYMGIFHEVQPADNALRCLDCHGPDGRIDWIALGYQADPLAEIFATSH
jgi:hypothetical protein